MQELYDFLAGPSLHALSYGLLTADLRLISG